MKAVRCGGASLLTWGAFLGAGLSLGCGDGGGVFEGVIHELLAPEGEFIRPEFQDVTGDGLKAAIELFIEDQPETAVEGLWPSEQFFDIAQGALQAIPDLAHAPTEPTGLSVPVFIGGSWVDFYVAGVVDLAAWRLVPGWFWMDDPGRERCRCSFEAGGCGACSSSLGTSWNYCAQFTLSR